MIVKTVKTSAYQFVNFRKLNAVPTIILFSNIRRKIINDGKITLVLHENSSRLFFFFREILHCRPITLTELVILSRFNIGWTKSLTVLRITSERSCEIQLSN